MVNGFICSKADPSFFFLNESIIAYMLIYVDDIILTGTNPFCLSQLMTQLSTEFALKNLGALHFFLGVKAQTTSKGMHLT